MKHIIYILLFSVGTIYGQSDLALLLNGCDNCIVVRNSENTVQNIVGLTIEAWVYSNCDNENRIIIGKEWCNGENSFYLSVNSGKLLWVTSQDGFCVNTDNLQSKEVVIPTNRFTHIAVVRNVSQTKLFVNGNEVESEWVKGGHKGIHSSSEPIRIGCYKTISGNFGNYFSGLIDNVRIWSKALTQNELRYSMNSSLTGAESELVINLDMESMLIGSNLNLMNFSNLNSNLYAEAFRYNNHSPSCISELSYESIEVDLGKDINICSLDPIELQHNINHYKEITWQDNSNTNSYFVNTPGIYSVNIETELCRFLADTISITLNRPDTTYLTYTKCENEVIQINGTTYDEIGNYFQVLQNVNGCDSLISINIQHFPKSEQFKTLSLCESPAFTINGITYNESGNYIQEVFDENGCDVQLNITINECRNECSVVDTALCYKNDTFPSFEFQMAKLYESSAQTCTYQSPLLADVDNDCIPEIIMSSVNSFSTDPRVTSGITFLISSTGATLRTINTVFYAWGGPTTFALADINGDGLPEIVVAAANVSQNPQGLRKKLVCYDTFGNILWISNETFGDFTGSDASSGAPAFADFNQDGIPEVYIYNEIFNATNGVKLASGGFNGLGVSSVNFNGFSNSTSIAADLDNNPDDLELAAGYTIYQVNINNPSGFNGNSMIPNNLLINNIRRDGYTSIGDINGDGKPDVVVSSQGNSLFSRLYVYTFLNNTPQLLASASMPTTGTGCCPEASGPAFIGDIDGSGTPSIGVARPYLLLAYKYNGTPTLNLSWQLNTNDESGSTGLTMFDFNQDGIQEIVYRDENLLRIINGSVIPPVNLAGFSCTSGTGSEYPIVGDIDYSGQSKICVPCGQNSRNRGRLHVFGAPANQQKWAPSRGIWNQYNYHVFNITDELSVPAIMKNNAKVSNGRFNNFLVQSSLLDSTGNFLQTSVELQGDIQCLYFDPLLNLYTVHFNIANAPTASASMTDPIKISFYNGNPSNGGTFIGLYTINLSLQPGKILEDLTYTFSSFNLSELFMVVNFDGDLNQGVFDPGYFETDECSFENNIASKTEIKEIITTTVHFCSGDSVLVQGIWYDQSVDFFEYLPTFSGCDSVIRYNLIAHDSEPDTVRIELCAGQCAEVDQMIYVSDTILTNISVSQYGCDSIKTHIITFADPQYIINNFILCQGDSIFLENQWIDQDIILYDSIATLPCPTFQQDRVRFNPSYFDHEKYILCPGDTLNQHNAALFDSGIYNFNFKTSQGCDSVFVVEILTLEDPADPVITSDCENQRYTLSIADETNWSWFWSNGSQNQSTTYPDSVNAFIEWIHDSLDCRVVYPFYLEPIPVAAPLFSLSDTIVYPGKPIVLNVENPGNAWSIHWSPTRNMSCDTCFTNTIITTQAIQIEVVFTHLTGCDFTYQFSIDVDPALDIQIPNIFSPDANAPNDKWTWFIPDCFEIITLKLYDRWGNLILDQENPGTVDWQGYFNGELVQQGVYTYIVKYLRPDGSIQTKAGDVTMIMVK